MSKKKPEQDFTEADEKHVERHEMTKRLRCTVPEVERLTAAEEFVSIGTDIADLKDEIKAYQTEIGAAIKAKEKRGEELAEIVRSRAVWRTVPCTKELDFTNGMMRLIRHDTGEVEEARPMTDDERQSDFLRASGEDAVQTQEEDGGGVHKIDVTEEMVDEALAIITELKRASTTSISRGMKVTPEVATAILDELEARTIVGPVKENGEPRDILVDLDVAIIEALTPNDNIEWEDDVDPEDMDPGDAEEEEIEEEEIEE